MSIWIVLLIVSLPVTLQAQGANYPEAGKPIPYFELNNLEYYPKKQITSDDLKGKFVILCFWNQYCSGGFKSLSKMEKLRREFKDQLEIFMVGGTNIGPESQIDERMLEMRDLYERSRKMQGLHLPVAYEPELFNHFVTAGVPYYVWVDDKGIVQAVSGDLRFSDVKLFLAAKPFQYADISFKYFEMQKQREDTYNKELPFLVDGNGGKSNQFQYRSLIAPYTNDMPRARKISSDMEHAIGKLEGAANLEDLYRLAYFGYYSNAVGRFEEENYYPITLRVKDTTPFKDHEMYRDRRNIYWYSLIVPQEKQNPEFYMETMQSDLKRFFGYKVTLEKQKLPYWSITLKKGAANRIKTKGDPYSHTSDRYTMIGFTNVSMDEYLRAMLYMFTPEAGYIAPMLDETGMEEHIDIPLTYVDRSNFEEVKKAMKKHGFLMRIKEKEFNVLVISDPE